LQVTAVGLKAQSRIVVDLEFTRRNKIGFRHKELWRKSPFKTNTKIAYSLTD
jgi:hypothetical protein